jgi:hypothetical protein
LSTPEGEWFRARNITKAEIIKDIIIPSKGAITIKTTILITQARITDPHPALATAAPTNPPTSVWDELDGRPYHHVRRFQDIAAKSAAAITVRLITSGLMTPFPIVAATLRGKIRNATKLKNAAIPTAAIGERTLVETTVAIEFAES